MSLAVCFIQKANYLMGTWLTTESSALLYTTVDTPKLMPGRSVSSDRLTSRRHAAFATRTRVDCVILSRVGPTHSMSICT